MATGNRVSVKDVKPSFSSTSKGTSLQRTKSVRTPYKLRANRQSTGSISFKETRTPELTKEQQQSRDLFDEDFDQPGPVPSRRFTKPDWELQTQSMKELESYAIDRSQDVTKSIVGCVRIAEVTTGIVTTTIEMLHEQGGQIRRTHERVVRVEDDLTVGEKLLGSLGGLFSRRWKPKKGDTIKGPQTAPEAYRKKSAQRDRAAVLSYDSDDAPRNQVYAKADKYAGLSGAQVRLQLERDRQDEALSDLGNVVSKLKSMTMEMNVEVDKQTAALGHMEHDVDAINDRVRQAYNRTRYLVIM